MGFKLNPIGKEDECFEKYGTIKEIIIPMPKGATIEYCELDHNQSSEDIVNVFGSFRFGLPFFNMTKLQTMEAYKEIGYEQVIPMTWFCADPLFGKPCGLCNSCEEIMKANIGFRLPKRSKILYKLFKGNSLGRIIDKKFKVIYNKYFRDRDCERYTYK